MYVYHTTKPTLVPRILQQGLVPNSPTNFTQEGSWADEVYGKRPIYVSLRESSRYSGTLLRIDTKGLTLYPDLPSLVDMGAYVEEEGMWWEEQEEPPLLKPYLSKDDGFISFTKLLKHKSIREAAIKTTQTGVLINTIEPARIQVVSKLGRRRP